MQKHWLIPILISLAGSSVLAAQEKIPSLQQQKANTWVKRSPLPEAPPSPMLGYEGSFGYDPKARLLIRWAGHNQGGGGEQNAETWTFDLATARWTLKEPNTSSPGACCNAQNVFDPIGGRFVRFSAFSGNHGWHWFRENYLSNSSVWTYDLATNTWRDMRPVPAVQPRALRCAAWDSDHQLIVLFGGEGSNDGTVVYDPYDNSWTRMNPKVEPKGRSAGNLAYLKSQQTHLLFGSQFGDDPETWEYDLRRNAWTDLKPGVKPPGDRNDAVLAYDENHGVIVASVRVFGQTAGVDEWHYETWTYQRDQNSWRKMDPNVEPPGGGQRRRVMVAVPDWNAVVMENYVNPPQKIPGVDREQQIWTYRYSMAQKKALPKPSDLQVETLARSAKLRWGGSTLSRFQIERLRPTKPGQSDSETLTLLPGKQFAFDDEELTRGWVYTYRVHGIDAQERRTGATLIARTQPKLVEDVIASVHSTTKVALAWPAAKEADVVGYHVERAPVEVFSEDQIVRLRTDTPPLKQPSVGAIKSIGKFERLTREPIPDTTFTDVGIDLAQKSLVKDEIFRHRFTSNQLHEDGRAYRYGVYAYRIRAVNRLGVESGGGPYALTIPSSPKALFSKEEGASCHLKWDANPEKAIAGYRVYRMESPRVNGPGQKVTRVTDDPIKEARYFDEKAGKETCRFWIVAVDALGQEGYPSAPAWHERQYKKIYQGFTGEWHQ
jgi:hypothetical protein